MADARLSISVSADAKQASAAFKDLAEDIKKVGGESVGVTSAVDRVDAALRKLASAPDTAGGLARATAKARIEVEDLRAELEKTPASAEKLKAIEAALRKADAAIQQSGNRAARLRDETEKLGQQMQVTAKGSEAMAGSFNSVQGVMAKMIDTGGQTTQSFATLGFKVLAVGEAFKFGYERGKEFDEGLKKIGVDLSDPISLLEKLESLLKRTGAAAKDTSPGIVGIVTGTDALGRGVSSVNPKLKELALGLLDIGKNAAGARIPITGLAADIDLESEAITEHTRALAGQVVARAAARQATADADAAIKAAIPGWTSAAEQQKNLNENIAQAASKFNDLVKRGADWRAEVEANREPMEAWAKTLEEGKVQIAELPPVLQDVISHLRETGTAAAAAVPALRDMVGTLKEMPTGQITASTQAFLDGINAQVDAIERYRAAVNDADIATGQWLQNQQRMSNLSGQTTGFMKAAEEQFRKTGEAIYTMTIMQTEFTKATEAQTDALKRMNESLVETWEGSGPGQRALDAIAQLVDLFKAGVLSLDGFNKNFAYLEEQLDRVIKAGGDLDGTLSGVLDALRKIANQVRQGPGGGRPSGPVGY